MQNRPSEWEGNRSHLKELIEETLKKRLSSGLEALSALFNPEAFTLSKAAAALFTAAVFSCGAAGSAACAAELEHTRPKQPTPDITVAQAEAKARAKTGKAGDHLILNNQSYFRILTEFGMFRLNGDALKKEGEALFGKQLSRHEKKIKKLLKHKNYDWNTTDWRDVACWHIFGGQAGDDSKAMALLRPDIPAKGWTEPGFDDSGFDRQRLGYLNPKMSQDGRAWKRSLLRRGLYIRTYIDVPVPVGAGDLTLNFTYRGGARVFVNGTEIGRGHLPDGDITTDTFGADYPKEAYIALPDELPPKPVNKNFIGDMRLSFERAPLCRRNKNDPKYRTTTDLSSINRKGWERLIKLRDRVMGPIRIPKKLLKKGSNVLAIEIRSARYHPIMINAFARSNGWHHARLVDITLTSNKPTVPSCLSRPKGLQAWADDMNKWLVDKDYNPAGFPAGTVRFVSGQNGTASALVGTGTDKALSGFKAEVTALTGPGGKIPIEAVTILYGVGHGLNEMGQLGFLRCYDSWGWGTVAVTMLWHYSDGKHLYGSKLPEHGGRAHNARKKYIENFKFFDHLSTKAPAAVSAGSCQPVWLSLKVPQTAAPGIYKGSVTISAAEAQPVTLPIEAEVIGWRVPSPQEFQTIVQSEQSPFGILKHYKMKPWSEEHWRLIESSFKQLARLGNDWVFIPVLMNSEIGNKEHVMVTGIRKKDGSYDFDFSIADKYLALARKTQGDPRMVCFLVMQAVPGPSNAVRILDEATGKTETMEVGPAQSATRGPFWRAFGTAVYAHMQELGLEDSLYFGQAWDQIPDKGLIGILDQVVPNAAWTCAAHARAPDATFRCAARTYGVDVTDKSKLSWKNPYIHLLMPRIAGSVMHVDGITPPFSWRVMADRALHSGFNGIGRAGADYFDRTWFEGVKGRYWKMVGRSSVMTLWPGADAVESSARNEAMLEGIQESDARIFMEQAIDRGMLPEALAKEAQAVLNDHFGSTLHLSVGVCDNYTMNIAQNAQNRTRRLFQTAAKVAAATGIDVDRTELGGGGLKVTTSRGSFFREESVTGDRVELPYLGQTRLEIKLRNWGSSPRGWKASADKPWIIPEKTSGKVTGQQVLGITLNGSTLKVGDEVSGTLTVTDTALGTAYPVKIAAAVTKALDYQTRQDVKFITGGGAGGGRIQQIHIVRDPVFNVTTGSSETRTYYLRNQAKVALDWKIDASMSWVKTAPASGKIPAGKSLPVDLVVAPTDNRSATYDVTLTLTSANGKIKETRPIKVLVIPAYRKPQLPEGEAVFLKNVDVKRCVKYMDWGLHKGIRRHKRPWDFQDKYLKPRFGAPLKGFKADSSYRMGEKTYTRGLWAFPAYEAVYDIEGLGYKAFSAEVGFFSEIRKHNNRLKVSPVVNFEIHVDGKVKVQSSLMAFSDQPRLLVVTGLENAKKIAFVVRKDDLQSLRFPVTWGDPKFYK